MNYNDGTAVFNGTKLTELCFAWSYSSPLFFRWFSFYCFRLAAKGSKVTCNAVHPGVVLTEVTRNMNAVLRIGYKICLPLMLFLQKTPSQGARTSLYVATSSALAGLGGQYFFHCEAVAASTAACDPEACKRLWNLSERLTGLVLGTAAQ